MGARRGAALGAAGLGALLLLLLARLPPPALRPAPRPAPRVLDLAPSSPAAPAAPAAPGPAAPSAPNATAAPALPATVAPSPAVPAAPPAPPRADGVVLTRDVWVSGHERPHPERCPALGARLRLLVLVSSAPSHAAAREAVRLTWGHCALRSDVAFAFVLGAPPPSLRPALDAEDALYGDLILGRSLDSYSNLTLKTLSMLEWWDTYCPRAPRLLKTDDDMFINVPRLLDFLAAPGRANATRTIWGKVLRRSLPKRTPKSKYYLSAKQFPGRVLPDFATGPAYVVTADSARRLLAAAGAQPYLRLEDVFVTGVLAARLRLRRLHAPEFLNRRAPPQPCAASKALALHMVRYHEQFALWRSLLDGKTKCA